MQGFEVDYDALAAEVAEVLAAGDELKGAVDAGLAAQEMSQNAFGLLCMMMVPPVQGAQAAAVAALTAEAAAFDAAGENLRNTAADYEMTDLASAVRYRAMRGKLV